MSLTKAQILQYKMPSRDVEIAELGGSVRVRCLTARESQELAELAQTGTDLDITLETILRGAVDDNGEQLFDESDRAALSGLPGRVLRQIADAILQLSRGEHSPKG